MPITRHKFLQNTLGVMAVQLLPDKLFSSAKIADSREIGIYITVDGKDVDSSFKCIRELGFKTCELYNDHYGKDMVRPLKEAMHK